jgi:hypothetical protein
MHVKIVNMLTAENDEQGIQNRQKLPSTNPAIAVPVVAVAIQPSSKCRRCR